MPDHAAQLQSPFQYITGLLLLLDLDYDTVQ